VKYATWRKRLPTSDKAFTARNGVNFYKMSFAGITTHRNEAARLRQEGIGAHPADKKVKIP